jgi:hypothetical protein
MGSGVVPGVNDVAAWLSRFGIGEHNAIAGVGLLYVASLVGLLFGWHTRLVSIAVWVTHTLLMARQTTSYGVDAFAHIFLTYLMLLPSGHAYSLDLAAGRVSSDPSSSARLGIRLLQIHLCIAYFFSGFEKALGEQWWNGEAIWRALMLPEYAQFDLSWLARVPWLAKILCWGTLLVEMAYPIFIWPRATRSLWIAAVVGLHLGILVFLGLGVFAVVMSILTLAIFGVKSDSPTNILVATN